MSASQDYRDGVSYGAQELRRRIEQVRAFGLDPNALALRAMADSLAHEYGGVEGVGEKP